MIVFVAALVGLLIVAMTVWSIRFIAAGPPAEPDLSMVEDVDVSYLCTVCGLSLTVSKAQINEEIEPPRHCREDMVRAI